MATHLLTDHRDKHVEHLTVEVPYAFRDINTAGIVRDYLDSMSRTTRLTTFEVTFPGYGMHTGAALGLGLPLPLDEFAEAIWADGVDVDLGGHARCQVTGYTWGEGTLSVEVEERIND